MNRRVKLPGIPCPEPAAAVNGAFAAAAVLGTALLIASLPAIGGPAPGFFRPAAAILLGLSVVRLYGLVTALSRSLPRRARPAVPRPAGPDVLNALVYGDDIPGLTRAALDKARDLYGPAAELAVERVGSIDTSCHSKGAFCTRVTVRCLNFFPGEEAP